MRGLYSSKDLSFDLLYLRFIGYSNRGRRLQPNGKRISAGTIKNYEYTLQLVKGFSADTNFQLRIRPAHKLNRRELITEKNYWKKFYKRFTDYLYDDCGFYDNYAGQHIKNLKVFATNHTSININMWQRNGAQLFEIKVQNTSD